MEDGVEFADLRGLVERGAIVLATAGGKGSVSAGSDRHRQFADRLKSILDGDRFYVRVLNTPRTRESLTEEELDRVIETYGERLAARIADDGIAEFMVAAPDLRRKLDTGLPSNPGRPCVDGQDIVWAATDWRRAGLLRPVTRELLRDLTEIREDRLAQALAWATEPVVGRSRLLYERHGGYQPHDVIVAHARDGARVVPERVWKVVVDVATRAELTAVAVQAYSDGHERVAEHAFRRAADVGDAEAAFNLGVLLEELSDVAGAKAAYEQAIDAGNADHGAAAAFRLGDLLKDAGHEDDARFAYEKGIAFANAFDTPEQRSARRASAAERFATTGALDALDALLVRESGRVERFGDRQSMRNDAYRDFERDADIGGYLRIAARCALDVAHRLNRRERVSSATIVRYALIRSSRITVAANVPIGLLRAYASRVFGPPARSWITSRRSPNQANAHGDWRRYCRTWKDKASPTRSSWS